MQPGSSKYNMVPVVGKLAQYPMPLERQLESFPPQQDSPLFTLCGVLVNHHQLHPFNCTLVRQSHKCHIHGGGQQTQLKQH